MFKELQILVQYCGRYILRESVHTWDGSRLPVDITIVTCVTLVNNCHQQTTGHWPTDQPTCCYYCNDHWPKSPSLHQPTVRYQLPSISIVWLINCRNKLTNLDTVIYAQCKAGKTKGKVLPYSLPNIRPGADPGVQAVRRRWLFKSSLAVGCHCLPPGLQSPSQLKERHRPSTSTKLYCLVTEAHGREQLVQGCYAALSPWKLNPQPINHKSNALPLCKLHH